MFQPLWQAVAAEFSGQGAWDQTAAIHVTDRLSTTAAFARTAEYVARMPVRLSVVEIPRRATIKGVILRIVKSHNGLVQHLGNQ